MLKFLCLALFSLSLGASEAFVGYSADLLDCYAQQKGAELCRGLAARMAADVRNGSLAPAEAVKLAAMGRDLGLWGATSAAVGLQQLGALLDGGSAAPGHVVAESATRPLTAQPAKVEPLPVKSSKPRLVQALVTMAMPDGGPTKDILIDKGEPHGVRRGMVFAISRDGQTLAQAMVKSVAHDTRGGSKMFSYLEVLEDSWAEGVEQEIKENDFAISVPPEQD